MVLWTSPRVLALTLMPLTPPEAVSPRLDAVIRRGPIFFDFLACHFATDASGFVNRRACIARVQLADGSHERGGILANGEDGALAGLVPTSLYTARPVVSRADAGGGCEAEGLGQ